jgi:hypothetical protein
MPDSKDKQDHRDWNQAMEKAFDDGTLKDATPDDLARWLSLLSTWKVDTPVKGNEGSRIIRSLAINHFQAAHVIRTIDKSNRSLQRWVIVLAVGALLAAGVQAGVALAFYFGHPSISKSYNEDAPGQTIQDNGNKEDASGGINPSPATPNPAQE